MKSKPFIFNFFLIFAFLSLWFRLFQLQIIHGAENRELADGNRIKMIKLPALRGVIYDRNGEILVRNTPEGREYIYADILAHVLGYIGEISAEELEETDQLGDIVGKMGIEKQYDQLLRGKDGGIIVETNVHGKIKREIKRQEPETGKNLTLTIDLGLQKKAFEEINGRKGAIIAVQPESGEILALVSSPSFNPNQIEKAINDPNQSMFNRVISGLYPPGSVFKIVTAIAGLEEEKINKSTLIEDTGEITITSPYDGKTFTYANWYYSRYGKKEGMVNIVKAIKRSNDIYFYKLGEWLGIANLVDWSKYFGLGSTFGIDLPGEAEGLVPTPKWKKEQKTESWYLGDTYITAIGQGNLQLTPLQVNQMSLVIASNGKFFRPHLSQDFESICQELNIDQKNIDLVKEGMKQACEEKGTAPIFADFEPKVACKTGTAEFGDPQDQTHAWFSVFAPLENPKIVLTVLLEKAGEGSKEAAPAAKEILTYWFARQKQAFRRVKK